MASDGARSKITRDSSIRRQSPIPGQRSTSVHGLELASEALIRAGGAEPVAILTALGSAPPAMRAQVMIRLQRERGNAYVQRVIASAQASPQIRTPRPETLEEDEQFSEAPILAGPSSLVADPVPGDRPRISADTRRATVIARQGGTATLEAEKKDEKKDDEKDGPLTPAQVERARVWYANHRSDYTPDIIKQIQAAVGADQDGLIGPQTIQAVARYQQANDPLAVDGIAGPRTLPALFPVGLAESKKEGEYVKEAKQVQTDWAKLKTADERAKALATAVNKQLTASGVPAANYALADLGDDSGQFDFATWTLSLGKKPFSQPTVTDAEAGDMADTVYHESRHCQQWFMMAQLRAGQGKSAKDIATELGIPNNIANAAVAKPLKHGSMEALQAKGFYESVYGSGSTHREKVLTGLDKKGEELHKAEEAAMKNPTKENQAKLKKIQAEYHAIYEQYRDLPEEADAWRVGGQITSQYTAGGKK